MIAKQGSIFKEAVCTYKKLTADEQLRLQIQHDEDVKRDNASVVRAAVNKAIYKIAEKMLMKGQSKSEVSELTGLSEEEIKELSQNH